MKILGAIALTSFFFLPNIVWAACIANGATVVYVNGIFTTNQQAGSDLKNLNTQYVRITGDGKTNFINGYNPSHVAGLGDLIQSAAQMMGKSISNFDRDTILLQIHPQVTTRKLLLVGHSQGAFYSNALYDYLLAHGEPKAAVGVYQVGSPASSVAGGGKYLNSSGDAMLGTLRGLGFKFLPDNIDLVSAPDDAQKTYPGHSFSGAYLAEAPERVVDDIQGTLKSLKADAASDTGECFTATDAGLDYQAAKAGFAVADTAANGIKTGAGAVQVAAVAAGNVLASAVQGAYGIAGKLVTDIGITVGGAASITHAAEPKSQPTNFDLLKKLYGSSLTKEEYKELLGTLGSAVATAPIVASVPQTTLAQADSAVPLLPSSGGARHHNEGAIQDTEQSPADAPTVPDTSGTGDTTISDPVATTTSAQEEATSTSEAPGLHLAPAVSPVVDSFDSYDGSGWATYGGSNNFGSSPGVIKYFATTSGECRSSGCLSGSEQIGNGGWGNPIRMYKTGAAVSEGSLVIWKKFHYGLQGVGNVWLMVCAGAPDAPDAKCEGTGDISRDGGQDAWTRYFLAWRNNGSVKEFCHMRDDTDQSHCSWQPSSLTAEQAPDTVVISGDAVRPDQGDRLWFDDLGTP
jgi:hypothetical protein